MKAKLKTLYWEGKASLFEPWSYKVELRKWSNSMITDYILHSSYVTDKIDDSNQLSTSYIDITENEWLDVKSDGEAIRYAVDVFKSLKATCENKLSESKD